MKSMPNDSYVPNVLYNTNIIYISILQKVFAFALSPQAPWSWNLSAIGSIAL